MDPLMVGDPRTILVAVDKSSGSKLALEWALKNYCKPLDKVRLVHVRKSCEEELSKWKLPQDAVEKLEAQSLAKAHDVINEYMKLCADLNFDCGWRIVTGDERDAIVKEVLHCCADVLIVGQRGLNPVKRALIGSVSEYCAHHCACPVIIVKSKDYPSSGKA